MSAFLLFAAMTVPRGQAFECTPVSVWDGDGTIWCAQGPRIGLFGIAARELDGSCSAGHPSPDADPLLVRDALVELVGHPAGVGHDGHILVKGPTMSCISTGSVGGDRTGSWCISPKSGDISCAMVRGAWAACWDRYWGKHECR